MHLGCAQFGIKHLRNSVDKEAVQNSYRKARFKVYNIAEEVTVDCVGKYGTSLTNNVMESEIQRNSSWRSSTVSDDQVLRNSLKPRAIPRYNQTNQQVR